MANGTTTGVSGIGWMQAASSLIEIWGKMEQGRAARIQGQRQKQAHDFAVWTAEQEAGQAIAISQRAAAEQRRQGEHLASRALAVAAASGAGVSDPTMVNILANVRGEANYRAAVALYEGESMARNLRLEAATGRVSGFEALAEGYARQQGYALAATGRGLREIGSLYARYGQNGPGTNTPQTMGGPSLIEPAYDYSFDDPQFR